MSTFTLNVNEKVLKRTISRCVICQAECPAEVVQLTRNGREQVVMRRTCPQHGLHGYTIASDAHFYWLAQGDPANSACGCGTSCSSAGGGKAGSLGINATDTKRVGVVEKLATCLALIEIVDSCNLACPTCFADSPVGAAGQGLKYRSFDDLIARIQGVIDRKGGIEVLQFSGGEPTLHPEFFRLVAWVRSHPKIDYLIVNTNGVRLAKDLAFVDGMGRIFREFDNIQLYLQFDGPQEAGQIALRGLDMRATRERAIRNCELIGLPITLAMTVNHGNLANLWDTVRFALPFQNIRGVSFQPEFLSGRNATTRPGQLLPQPITTADIILGLNGQSSGAVSIDDFTPLPCGDPNCATIGWLFRAGGKYHSPATRGIDIRALQEKLPNRVNYNIEDLKRCGCENTALGDLMKQLEVTEAHAMRLFIKPFMDARTWDKDRTDRCCTHVIRPDGTLASFCEYYSMTAAEAGR